MKLLLVATGAIQAATLPMVLASLRSTHRDIEFVVGVTTNALRFTTLLSLREIGGSPVLVDEWEEAEAAMHHVELAEWPDAVLVYPMSFSFLGRMAAGFGSGPVLLALQSTKAPIMLCPSFPPGLWDTPIARRNLGLVLERENVSVMPAAPAVSAHTGESFIGGAADFEHALLALREMIES